jgi:hypothetical protein
MTLNHLGKNNEALLNFKWVERHAG